MATPPLRIGSLISIVLPLWLGSACASTGATFRSGVGDTFLERPPYIAGAARLPATATPGSIGVLPLHVQQGAGQPALFEPDPRDTPYAALLRDMDRYIDSLTLASGAALRRVSAAMADGSAPGVAPDVRFGCITEHDLPDADCVVDGDAALGRGRRQMKLAVGRPSAPWVRWSADAMARAEVTHAIVFTLEVGQYLPRQTGLAGNKSVELGRGHVAELPWLTSLETPLQVLQLTAVLVDREGQAVRIAAEGMLAKRTRFLASAAGAQELLSPDDVAALRERRRADLPGRPLVWQAAMQELVRQLTR